MIKIDLGMIEIIFAYRSLFRDVELGSNARFFFFFFCFQETAPVTRNSESALPLINSQLSLINFNLALKKNLTLII